jgi:hypothetical protein
VTVGPDAEREAIERAVGRYPVRSRLEEKL